MSTKQTELSTGKPSFRQGRCATTVHIHNTRQRRVAFATGYICGFP